MITHTNSTKFARWAALATALVAAALLAGCSGGDTSEREPAPLERTKAEVTAKSSLEIARSAVATAMPDAKLLVVQTGEPATASDDPSWSYLFGSPSSGKTYLVFVSGETITDAAEYGDSDLTEEDWEQVPELTDWKIDSDAAYRKAVEAAGVTDPQMTYMMGMQTYYPDEDAAAQEATAFTWYVYFDPLSEESIAVAVNARTGEAVVE